VSLSTATLLLVRHADIDCSSNGLALLCGSYDAPLSATGRLQLAKLKRRLAAEPNIQALYSSPLRRAVQTAQAAPPEFLASLRMVSSIAEIHCGAVEGIPLDDVRQRFPEYWRRNEAQADENFCWPGGETYRRFRRRVLVAIRTLSRMHAGQKIIVVTHAGVINQILGSMVGQSAAKWENFRPGNASITEISWRDDTGQLLRFNDQMHLN
jgi:broad specificity phosphatase PhoE